MGCANKPKICTGDLDSYIQIEVRRLVAPSANNQPLELDFENYVHAWANIKTVNGVTLFDEVNQEQSVTHIFTTRYLGDAITAEKWIIYANKRYRILQVENINESNTFLRMRCQLRGYENKEGTKT